MIPIFLYSFISSTVYFAMAVAPYSFLFDNCEKMADCVVFFILSQDIPIYKNRSGGCFCRNGNWFMIAFYARSSASMTR